MKILFSDNSLWGLLNFRGGIIRHFVSKGYEVILVAPLDNEGMQMKIPERVKYIPICVNRSGRNPISDIKYFYDVVNIYKRERPDYIFHYTIKPNIYGTIAARILKIRSSAMIAGLGYAFAEKTLSAFIARAMYKYSLRYAEYVFVLNENNYKVLIDGRITSDSKVIWLKGGEGVDLNKFCFNDTRNNVSMPRFLMVSRLLYDKGYSEFVAAANKLKSYAKFVVMGAIDSRPSAVPLDVIKYDVAHNNIEYIAFSPNVISQMEQADCIVLPSYYSEGLSRVLMEACAIGRPIICSDIPGCKETVENGVNGFICHAKDSQSLIECCEKFIALSQKERREMGQAGRLRAEDIFDERIVIDEYDKILSNNIG